MLLGWMNKSSEGKTKRESYVEWERQKVLECEKEIEQVCICEENEEREREKVRATECVCER